MDDDDDEGVVISGYVVYFEPLRSAGEYEREARALEAAARTGANPSEREQLLREAAEQYVNAFLVDRTGRQSAFDDAHRLGCEVLEEFGCPYTLRDDGQSWSLRCGIRALHSRLGTSPGGPTLGECSVCGAPDFECDHLNGEVYDGKQCFRLVTRCDLQEISLVPRPYDPRCYRLDHVVSARAVERARGRPLLPDEAPTCDHCGVCTGTPVEEDLHPEAWEGIPVADVPFD